VTAWGMLCQDANRFAAKLLLVVGTLTLIYLS
jgi:hypothetical protein